MKGGKGGRQRRTGKPDANAKPASGAPAKKGARNRAKSTAPKKGERKNTRFGWSSSSEE
jgi:hypothetical protein